MSSATPSSCSRWSSESLANRWATERTETELATSPERWPPIPSATTNKPKSGTDPSPEALPSRANSASSLWARSTPVDWEVPTMIRRIVGPRSSPPSRPGSRGAGSAPSGWGLGAGLREGPAPPRWIVYSGRSCRRPLRQECVNPVIQRSEVQAVLTDGSRPGDGTAGLELPALAAGAHVQAIHRPVHRSAVDRILEHDRRTGDLVLSLEMPDLSAAAEVDRVHASIAAASVDASFRIGRGGDGR